MGVKKQVLSGPELIKSILKMQVDLLWFGGIGTYIKASDETHVQVGDSANNSVRIDAKECRAKVIGEGANLGVTQLARIELTLNGCRLNTDAIDNSAGVNMSDYEVNLKILLKSMVDQNIITQKKQRTLLEKATDEVTELVLQNNRDQHQQLSLDSLRCSRNMMVFAQLIQELIDTEQLDPISWFIPSQSTIAEYEDEKQPIPRCILSIIQAHVKMHVFDVIKASPLVKNNFFDSLYTRYFPDSLFSIFKDKIHSHPLKHDIIAMLVTNNVINFTGATFIFQLQQATKQPVEQIIQTYIITDYLLDGMNFRQKLEKESVTQDNRYRALMLFEDILLFVTKDLLQMTQESPVKLDQLDHYKHIAKQIQKLPESTIKAPTIQWKKMGFSSSLSFELSRLSSYEIMPEIIYLNDQKNFLLI